MVICSRITFHDFSRVHFWPWPFQACCPESCAGPLNFIMHSWCEIIILSQSWTWLWILSNPGRSLFYPSPEIKFYPLIPTKNQFYPFIQKLSRHPWIGTVGALGAGRGTLRNMASVRHYFGNKTLSQIGCAFQEWDWPGAKLAKMHRNLLQIVAFYSCSWIVMTPTPHAEKNIFSLDLHWSQRWQHLDQNWLKERVE